jgi:ATP-dependent Clp protease ATP-binding subunit ClpC
MFQRFTDRARRVVVFAQEEARNLSHDHTGAEHVLLGLVREGSGVAAKALESLGIGLETVRERTESAAGRGDQEPPPGRIPFTEQAKDLLKLSLRESVDLGHDYVGTEHILLGVLRQGESTAARVLGESTAAWVLGESTAARVLADLGASHERVRAEVVRLLEEYQRRRGQQDGEQGGQAG